MTERICGSEGYVPAIKAAAPNQTGAEITEFPTKHS